MADIAVQLQKIASNATIQAQKLANQATEKSFQYNAKEANTARTWQKMMSDTAHQREVSDLKKAGLNPVLATNQGAQSYTTSSAQAQANDPSGAAASLAASEMAGISQGYAADRSAAATRYAAQKSAAAMRAAAAEQASAARYAAAMQYQTQKDSWSWKTKYMKEEYKEKTKYALNTPVNSWSGLADKLTKNSGFQDTLIGSKTVKSVINTTKKLVNDPQKYFKVTTGIASGNFVGLLNSAGKRVLDNNLSRLGVKQNRITRNLAVRALVYGSTGAWNALIRYMPRQPRSNVSAADKYRAYSMR